MKDTVKSMKRHAPDWEKIFAKHISYKGLICRLYKECKSEKIIRKIGKNFEQIFRQRHRVSK